MTGGAPAGVCFVVLSHAEPDLVERLVRLLAAAPSASVLVRHDSSQSTFAPQRVADLAGVDVLADAAGAPWGSWALTERTLEAVAHAVARGPAWDWLVLVSGQSYPLRPVSELCRDLASTDEDAVLDLAPPSQQAQAAATRWRPYGADRARYHYHRLPWTPLWERHPARRALLSVTGSQPFGGVSFHRPRGQRRFVADLVHLPREQVFAGGRLPVKASQWWALRRGAAEAVLDRLQAGGTWHEHFRRTFTSDELAVPSALSAVGAAVRDAPLHALSWPSGPSPRTLDEGDLPWLSEQVAPFTRKVTLAAGGALLDVLDQRRTALEAAPGAEAR